MVYLIGVNHIVQSRTINAPDSPAHRKYRECLVGAIKAYHPALVGEEYSKDALAREAFLSLGIPESFTKIVAGANGIEHRFCDPELKVRFAMGYQGKEAWLRHIDGLWDRVPYSERTMLATALEISKDVPMREQYWLKELSDVLGKDLIFVCGESHIDSFRERLESKNISVGILERNIGMGSGMIEESAAQLAYAKANARYVEEQYQTILEEHGGTIQNLVYPE